MLLKPLWKTGFWENLKKSEKNRHTEWLPNLPMGVEMVEKPYTYKNKDQLQGNLCRIRWSDRGHGPTMRYENKGQIHPTPPPASAIWWEGKKENPK